MKKGKGEQSHGRNGAFQVVSVSMPAFRFRRFCDDLARVTFDSACLIPAYAFAVIAWLVVGADLLRENNIVDWLVVGG